MLLDSRSLPKDRCAQNCAHFGARQLADDVMAMPFVQVGIYLCRPDRLVPQEYLDSTDVARPHHQIAREPVPPGVEVRIRYAESGKLVTEFRLYGMDVELAAVLLCEDPSALAFLVHEQAENDLVHRDRPFLRDLRDPDEGGVR
jgi:hypothetical protein